MQPTIVCLNEDPGLTLTCFTPRSNLVSLAFVWEKVKIFNLAETIAAFDLKVRRCIELYE